MPRTIYTETDAKEIVRTQSLIADARQAVSILMVTTNRDFDYQLDKIIYQLNRVKRAVDDKQNQLKLEKIANAFKE
jgi:hypothetical protein